MKIHYLKLAVASFIVLALVAAALPHAALAATTCSSYYTVVEGDTTPKISHTFGYKWRDIADANDLDRAWKPVAGTQLCLPAGSTKVKSSSKAGVTTDTSVPSDSKASFSAQVNRKQVTITASDFTKKQVFFVKIRDANERTGGWTKIGNFKIPKNSAKTQTYQLPQGFRDTAYIDVCLKNASTDELICRTVLNTY